MPLAEATLHGAAGIAVPTLVSTLAICCVFTSVVFLDGPAKYLFTPLGLAVVFAMLASYGLSRTLTPIIIGMLLRARNAMTRTMPPRASSRGYLPPSSPASNTCATAIRSCCDAACAAGSSFRSSPPILGLGGVMLTLVGRDFFPLIDGGQIQLHVRAPAGTRIEAPKPCSSRSRTRSAKSSRRTTARSSSTISACRRAPIISPSPTARPSASTTASSWSR